MGGALVTSRTATRPKTVGKAMRTLDAAGADLLFRKARTQNGFLDKPVDPKRLHEIYELMKWAPTSANSNPVRIIFLTTPEAKARLEPALISGNLAKTRAAPVTAIIGYDLEFFDHLPRLFPHADMKPLFENNEMAAQITAFRNGTLQGAYFIFAARAVGLDCGPMSGFDNGRVDHEFFAGTHIKSNFLCNLGYGDTSKLFPRSPRFEFDEICQIL